MDGIGYFITLQNLALVFVHAMNIMLYLGLGVGVGFC